MDSQEIQAIQQRDAELASRTLHDAELIRHGAAYNNGRLELTKSQVSTLALEASTIGRLVLRSDAEEAALEPTSLLLQRIENSNALQSQLHDRLAPYDGMFDEFVPPASRNKRGLLSLFEYKQEPLKVASKRNTVGTLDAQYDFSVVIERGKQENTLMGVRMDVVNAIADPNYFRGVWTQYMTYTDGQLTKIQGWHYRDALPESLFGSEADPTGLNPVAALYNKSFAQYGCNAIVIELGETPAVRFTNEDNKYFEYRHNPDANNFGLIEVGHPFNPDNRRPKAISTDDFANVVSGMLALIPASK